MLRQQTPTSTTLPDNTPVSLGKFNSESQDAQTTVHN